MLRPRIFDRVRYTEDFAARVDGDRGAGEIQKLWWEKRQASDDFPDGRCVIAQVKWDDDKLGFETVAVNLLRPAPAIVLRDQNGDKVPDDLVMLPQGLLAQPSVSAVLDAKWYMPKDGDFVMASRREIFGLSTERPDSLDIDIKKLELVKVADGKKRWSTSAGFYCE
jgi:hypothetical protein